MTDRETEPGTLPEGIEQQIEKWRQARMYTDPRTGDVLLCSLSLIGYVSDLRSIARAAYAEGAAQERARLQKAVRLDGTEPVTEAAYCHHRHHLDEHSTNFDTCSHFICVHARAFIAARTPPPPEAQE